MPRIGRNPMKWTSDVYHPKDVTITTIVFIPSLSGYWEQGLDVLKVCLHSLHENTSTPFDLFVFDNGSCSEVQDYLLEMRRNGLIQCLMLSQHNIGKTGAWNVLFSAAPGVYVAYMDSDVLFFPGWLEQSLDVLKAFPKTGLVSAQSYRWEVGKTSVTLANIADNSAIRVKTGQLLSERHKLAQRMGLGYSLQTYQEALMGKNDILISTQGISAYVGATHFQFLTTKELIAQVIPIPVTALISMDENHLQSRVNSAGRWQLSTTEYLVHHLGNRLPVAETEFDGLEGWYPQDLVKNIIQENKDWKHSIITPNRLMLGILKTPPIQKFLQKLNTSTYHLLTVNHQSYELSKGLSSLKENREKPHQSET